MFLFFKKNLLLIISLALVIFLRLPSVYEPYWHGDEGITLTVGQGLQRGAVLYRDIDDNKTPLLYFLAGLVDNLAQFKFLLMLWSLLTALIFYQLAGRWLYGRARLLASFLFVLLANTPILEANIINAEIFFLLMTAAGMLFLLRQKFFISGCLFSLGFLFKVPVVFDFLAALGFTVFFAKSTGWPRLVLGFALPLLVMTIYFWFKQSLGFFISSVFLDNFSYANNWNLSLLTVRQYLLFKTIALALVFLWLRFKIKNSGKSLRLLLLWFFFALFGATLSSRPYTHYLIQIIPALVLAIFVVGKRAKKILWLPLLSLAAIIFLQFTALHGPFWQANIFYYQRFWRYAFGQISTEEYRQSFDEKVAQTYAVSQFLDVNSRPDEPIFYFGDNALIYALSKRPPATRLTTAYNIMARQRQRETLLKLRQTWPRLILISQKQEGVWPSLMNFVLSEYQLIKAIEGVKIYEKKAIAV